MHSVRRDRFGEIERPVVPIRVIRVISGLLIGAATAAAQRRPREPRMTRMNADTTERSNGGWQEKHRGAASILVLECYDVIILSEGLGAPSSLSA